MIGFGVVGGAMRLMRTVWLRVGKSSRSFSRFLSDQKVRCDLIWFLRRFDSTKLNRMERVGPPFVTILSEKMEDFTKCTLKTSYLISTNKQNLLTINY